MAAVEFAASVSKAAIDARFDALMLSQVAGLINTTTWTLLSTGFTGPYTNGAGAKCYGPDAGTHTDPVVGGIVPNTGIYAWDTAHSAFRRIAALTSDAMVPINFDQGVINDSNPAFNATQTLDDLAHPGITRKIFKGIVLNWIRQNYGGESVGHAQFQLQLEGNSYFDVVPDSQALVNNGTGSDGALMTLKDPLNPFSIGFEQRRDGFGSYLRLDNVRNVLVSWAQQTPGLVNLWYFQATGRTHFWSGAAWVHEATNGRFEWETGAAGPVSFVGFQSGSANGRPIDFNDLGQSVYTDPVVSITSQVGANKLLSFLRGTGRTLLSYVDGNGIMNAKQFKYIPILVSALPAAGAGNNGMKAYVTDATNTNRRDPVVGSGANHAEVICRNGAWEIC